MTFFVLAIVLISAFLHAGWNLLARSQRSEAQFFDRMLIAVAVIGLVPAAFSEWQARSLGWRAWACAAGSGIFCAFYYLFLAKGYASSEFTLVYPVARAIPVILVGLGDAALGRPPTAWGWAGILLVGVGCFLVPLRSLRDFALARYLNRTSLWMLLAALGTVGYTLLDKAAAEIVPPGPATAARYGYAFYLASCIAYAALFRVSRAVARVERSMTEQRNHSRCLFSRQPFTRDAIGWWRPIWAGGLNFGAYWLVLWAYQLSERASYLVAFRQFSIVIGVILAFCLYRERGWAIRLLATWLITIGLLVIGIGGH